MGRCSGGVEPLNELLWVPTDKTKSGGKISLAGDAAALVDCTPERTAAEPHRRQMWQGAQDLPGSRRPSSS